MKQEMTHTPTPWKMSYRQWPDAGFADAREVQFCGADGSWVGFTMQGRVNDETGNANAAFIVRACNAHDELVDALEDAEFLLRQAGKIAGPMQNSFNRSAQDARDALAKAKGEQ